MTRPGQCADCAELLPRHQYFCSAVATYTREQTLREMLALEDRMAALSGLTEWCTKLADGDGTLAAIALRRSFSLVRHAFWGWADRLGVHFTDQRQVRALRRELHQFRKAQQAPATERPPWKQRLPAA